MLHQVHPVQPELATNNMLNRAHQQPHKHDQLQHSPAQPQTINNVQNHLDNDKNDGSSRQDIVKPQHDLLGYSSVEHNSDERQSHSNVLVAQVLQQQQQSDSQIHLQSPSDPYSKTAVSPREDFYIYVLIGKACNNTSTP